MTAALIALALVFFLLGPGAHGATGLYISYRKGALHTGAIAPLIGLAVITAIICAAIGSLI